MRKIIHIDMDAFYASVEQRDNPELRGMPVAVGHGAKRGVVAAASYEARKFGVRSAMPSITAQRQCASLVFVPPRFDVYRAVSLQIRSIFADYTTVIEPLSLDEAYLDVTENSTNSSDRRRSGDRNPPAYLRRDWSYGFSGCFLQQVSRQTGLRFSQAKWTIRHSARSGRGFRGKSRSQQISRHRTCHGGKDGTPWHRDGRRPAEQVRRVSFGTFWQVGPDWYYAISRGEDDRAVRADRERKSSGSETTFLEDLTEASDIEREVLGQADEVWAWCVKANAFGRTVTVKIKYADFQQATRSRSLTSRVSSKPMLHEITLGLIRSVLPARKGIRLVGVTVSNFETTESSQLGLAI